MDIKMADTHALRRTSHKGGPFVGTCFKCGATGLPAVAVSWPCENVANLNADETLLIAVTGDTQSTVGES